MTIRIVHDATGVEFRLGDVFARADTSHHDVRLTNHRGATMHLAAVRASLLTSMAFVSDTFGIAHAGQDFTPVPRAIKNSLVRRAKERSLHDTSLEAQIEEMVPTPLLYAAPFLEARFVWADAFRFRPCRVAIAHVEDDALDEDALETAAKLVERLGRWRDLFSPAGKAARALNAALQQFGETMPAEALWGLRKVALGRPRTEQAPLEVLGWMAAAGHVAGGGAALSRLLELVEAASDSEMQALLGERRPRDAALFLLEGDPDSTTLLQLARSAAERLAQQHEALKSAANPRSTFPPLPLAPPDVDGIRWISTVDALRAESASMHHCVQHLAMACMDGDAWIFHVEKEGTRGTVHVDRSGRVVEYRGPFNRDSLAASWGASVLRRWGAGLWIHELGADTLAWPRGLATPPGTTPLRSVRAIHEAYQALVRQRPEDLNFLAAWFRATARMAATGEVGVYLRGDAPDRAFVRSKHGNDLGDTTTWHHERHDRVYLERGVHADVIRFAMSPIPPPLRMGLALLEDEAGLQGFIFHDDAQRERIVRAAATGERFYLRYETDSPDGSGRAVLVLVEVDREAALTADRNTVRAVVVWGGDDKTRARAEAVARKWAYGFWAARIGLARNTWHGDRRVPHGAEPLRTVEACLITYRQICDYIPDEDGRVARFFGEHAEAAADGRAWILVRDRSEGHVTVLDRRGNIRARLEDMLALP